MFDPNDPFGVSRSDYEDDDLPQPGETVEDFRRRKQMASLYTGGNPVALDTRRAAAVVDPSASETERVSREINPFEGMDKPRRDLLTGAPGEAYSRYMSWAKNNPPPTPDQFKPKLSQKILAAIAGFKYGMQGRGDLAIEIGDKIRNAGYDQAMHDYSEQDKALQRSASMEERERSIARRQTNAEARIAASSWKTNAKAFEDRVKGSAAQGARTLEIIGKSKEAQWKKEDAARKQEFQESEKLKADERSDKTNRRLATSAELANDLKRRELETESAPTVLSPTQEREGIQNLLPKAGLEHPGWEDHIRIDDKGNPLGPEQIKPGEEKNPKVQAMLQRLGKSADQYNKDAVWLWDEMRKKSQSTYSRTPGRRVRRIQ